MKEETVVQSVSGRKGREEVSENQVVAKVVLLWWSQTKRGWDVALRSKGGVDNETEQRIHVD